MITKLKNKKKLELPIW